MSWRHQLVPDNDDTTTTMRNLLHVLNTTSTPLRPLPGSGFLKRTDERIIGVDCDEVYPRLYIGDAGCAKSKAYLKLLGINYVLNTAEGSRFGQVDTGHLYYRDMPTVRYMGFPMIDMPVTNIAKYFYVAAKFIDEGITSGGRVLVHCHMGMSRSATCVLAWLMICRHMTATEALRTVRMHRDIRPNDGFLRQLMELDNDLKLQRATKNLKVR